MIRNLLRAPRRWWRKSHHWQGRLVELMGNRVRIEGCWIDTSSPQVPTLHKAQLLNGRYERKERRLIKRFFDPTTPVVELGACIGVVACSVNRRLHDRTAHVVVEANPELIPLLTANRDRNGLQFTIIHGALAYGSDEVVLPLGLFTSSSFYRPSQNVARVRALSLVEIAKHLDNRHFNLICDIEGSESALVENEIDFMASRVKHFVVETHASVLGEVRVANAETVLAGRGFVVVERSGAAVLFRNQHLT